MTTIGSTFSYSPADQYAARRNSAVASETPDGSAATDRQPGKSHASAATASGANLSPVTVNFGGKLTTMLFQFLDMSKVTTAADMPEDVYGRIIEMRENDIEMSKRRLENQHTHYSRPSLHAGYDTYATVSEGGKVVATIDNQGHVTTYDGFDQKRLEALIMGLNVRSGPGLAKLLAEQIAAMTRGRVSQASTAITQRQFDALRPIESTVTVDRDAMKADPLYQEIQDMQAKLDEMKRIRQETQAQRDAGAASRFGS